MIVREYTDADFSRIKEMYEKSGFDYQLPSLSRENFFSRRVVGSGDSIGMAAFQRHVAEVYLVCDPDWRTPAWRLEALKQLQAVSLSDAKSAGVKEVCGFVPPSAEKQFGKRLVRMGWSFFKDEEWRCYSLPTGA